MFENSDLSYKNMIGRYFIEYYDGSTFVLDIYWDRNAINSENKRMNLVLYCIDVSEIALSALKRFVNDFNSHTSVIDQRHVRHHFSKKDEKDSFDMDDKEFIKNWIEFKLGSHSIKSIKTVDELETGIGENELTRLSDYS